MENTKKHSIIPEQNTGSKTDIESSVFLNSIEEAGEFFKTCKARLLNINGWGELAGIGSADFKLTDKEGKEIGRQSAEIGDHFKIDIPGPGTITGEGYDWAEIESIEHKGDDNSERQSTAIRARPSTNPENSKSDVAHFFSDDATSSFIVERRGTTVSAGVHGRNEKPNVEADSIVDMARNVVVAGGAIAGFSPVQWKKLVNGIVGK